MDGRGATELRPIDTDLLDALLHPQAATVAVVTMPGRPARRGRPALPPAGFTAASFTAVSLEPPLVSFCLASATVSWPAVARAEHVAVHLFAAGQQGAARALAAGPGWSPGPFGVPLVDGALAVLLCRVTHRVPAGDHAVVIAAPLALGSGRHGAPPLRDRGAFSAA
ncbi:flavin reductase family protein [Micromonospora carbonacea]|uniref:NADH-FMN oxidoreductase RutF, flavin reductase (DIM6/NTAB) family n=1 Tax=Micromonospora carbonacea TaxID=47853 RepID=A0A1C5AXD8_9ACTN|nr:flavin reductase family protein [Micromonospora carbonacea]SCF49888.1 NADH-FMN oxidoreductase RutF, flavin reductase (DIM6/NTAB) family [Micromonospora carbonacea]